jgi:organic radical activating enzyme
MKAKIMFPFNITNEYPDNCLAILIYFVGCDLKCKGCNQSIKINYKEFIVEELVNEIHKACKKYKTNKIILSGGDPFSKYNSNFVYNFLQYNSEYQLFDVCIYTGLKINRIRNFLKNTSGFNYIKSNRYDYTQKIKFEKTKNYIQFSSLNQKLYDSNYHLLTKNGKYYFKKPKFEKVLNYFDKYFIKNSCARCENDVLHDENETTYCTMYYELPEYFNKNYNCKYFKSKNIIKFILIKGTELLIYMLKFILYGDKK